MNAYLREVSRIVAAGAHAVLVMDGAGYNETAGITVPYNISLLTLRAYSPELNPVENVWQFLRQNYRANCVFENYEAFPDACCDTWRNFLNRPDKIVSIT